MLKLKRISGRVWLTIVLILFALLIYIEPVPFVEHNSTTLIFHSMESQEAFAVAISQLVGSPSQILNTNTVDRYLFSDQTSVDYPKRPSPCPYQVTALKQVITGIFSQSPITSANRFVDKLGTNFQTKIDPQPDPAYQSGDIVLVCYAEQNAATGAGLLIRQPAFIIAIHGGIHGPRPISFHGFD